MNFKSDNTTQVSPQILDAIAKANFGYQSSYGADDLSKKLNLKLSEIFETEVQAYITSTGTAANCLGLSTLIQPFQTILCHKYAHIATNEANASAFYTNGTTLDFVSQNKNCKISAQDLVQKIKYISGQRPHRQAAGCISLTQATESGTIYSLEEMQAIKEVAAEFKLPIHLDGARFANALVSLNTSPAKASWQSGINVMSFGATKNGALCGEAVIFFGNQFTSNFDYLHKRAGQLISKTRFFAAQLLAYLEEDLWLKNARHANEMATKLEQVFKENQVEINEQVQTNQLFVNMTQSLAQELSNSGVGFYKWQSFEEQDCYRFVTSWQTTEEELANFSTVLRTCLKNIKR